MKLLQKIKSKTSSNAADPISLSMILWIALAVVVVILLFSILLPAIFNQTDNIANEIECTGTLLGSPGC
jgi:glucan phosphoethanolaminetransferase (alkaline phosphatase superfamily)